MRTSSQTTSPTYLTIAEAAGILRRKPWPVLQAIEAGELRAFQPGGEGAWLIDAGDLGGWVAASVNASGDALSKTSA